MAKERIQVIGKELRAKILRKINRTHGPKGTTYNQVTHPKRAERLCRDFGFTNQQLATAFGVHHAVITVWRRKYPTFHEAITRGKDAFDQGIAEGALIRRVTGYDLLETTRERVKTGATEFNWLTGEEEDEYELRPVKTVTKHLPPDVSALKMWLGTRCPARWQEKQVIDLTTTVDKLSDEELDAKITELLTARALGVAGGETPAGE